VINRHKGLVTRRRAQIGKSPDRLREKHDAKSRKDEIGARSRSWGGRKAAISASNFAGLPAM
jgi:hypothetical protein